MAWQRTRIYLPEGYAPKDREAIGEAIVEYIRDRTAEGTGIRANGRLYDFPAYTKEYKKFKGQNRVDLRLSDEMMDELKVLRVGTDSILIGYEPGSEVNDKAEGNIIGSYGRDPNPRKARNFLGINKSELELILAGFD